MAVGQKLRIEALRSLAFGSVGAAYANVGTPLVNPAQIILLQNLTDVDVKFSFDGGTVDHFYLPAGGQFVLDVASDSVSPANALSVSVGTQIAVKRAAGAPSSGGVYISAMYSR